MFKQARLIQIQLHIQIRIQIQLQSEHSEVIKAAATVLHLLKQAGVPLQANEDVSNNITNNSEKRDKSGLFKERPREHADRNERAHKKEITKNNKQLTSTATATEAAATTLAELTLGSPARWNELKIRAQRRL